MVAITSSNGSHDEYSSPVVLSHEAEENASRCSIPRKTLRKQWSVQGEPRQLLKKLRNQLAEDGCPESQYMMAKALLDHSEDLNYEENCHQAIFWLTQASLQGYVEATELLKHCLEKGLGICEQNYQDVKRCLEMDPQEKLALVAGKQLFNCLSEGNEFVTQRKLEGKMSEILNEDEEYSKQTEDEACQQLSQREMKTFLEEKYGSQRLSENHVVDAALSVVKGDIPSVHVKESSISGSKRTFRDRFVFLHFFVLSLTERHFFCKFNILLQSPFYCLSGSLICLVLLFSMFSWSEFAVASLVVMWFLCYFFMSCSAISILIRYRDKKLFAHWVKVFQHFCPDLNANLAYGKYKINFLISYLTYFSCMVVYLSLLPVVSAGVKALITPPFFLVSCCIFTSLFQTNLSFNCISSLFYVLAHYSTGHLYVKEWVSESLPALRPYIFQETFKVQDALNFNFDFGSIFQGLWVASLVFASASLGVSGILVHVLSVTWFHLALLASGGFSDGWIHTSLFVWGLILILPQGLNFVTIAIPSVILSLCFYVNDFSVWVSFSSFIVCITVLYTASRISTNLSSVLKFLVFLVSSTLLFQEHTISTSKISPLKWDQFQNICFPVRESFDIHTIRECRPFKGTIVQWQATLKQVEIESISNLPEAVLSVFPPMIEKRIRCSLGYVVPPCESLLFRTEMDRQRCLLKKDITGAECSLEEWNMYAFQFLVSMESNFWKFSKDSDVTLLGGNEFKNVAFNLSVHDRISFTGTLEEGLGTTQPKISLLSMNCIDCKVKNLYASNKFEISIDYHLLSKSLKSTFNFFFGPTISI